jgi:hypothetical protein
MPREWGGETVLQNLWAICEECNSDKKDYFKSVDVGWMRKIMAQESIHIRLGETLKTFQGEPMPAAALEAVANQDDWKKRVRELRYLGWEIETFSRRLSRGGRSSYYRLVKSQPWPGNPSGIIRQYERDRARRNRADES